MEKKLTSDHVKSLLTHVISTIDRWWVEKTDRKRGYFTRSKCESPDILYQDYVEWRFASTNTSKDYESIFISLDLEDGTDYICIALKTMKNGVYAKYDPFCEIYNGKTEVVISEQTGFGLDSIMHDVLTCQDFDVLTDAIADTVHRFVTPTDEEEAIVNMDDVSKTLSAHDIQDCMIKAMRIMIIDRDSVNELTRLRAKYVVHDVSAIQCKNMLGYAIDVTPKHVITRILYGDDAINAVTLCSFTCEPDTHGQHEFIIRYNSCDTGFNYEQGLNILYKNPDNYCFEYAADGLNVEKVFKPFVNILRNTLNYELYQSLHCSQDTKITAPAGLTTKEIFVLDENFFKSGDIYLLHISPKFHGDIHNGTALAPDAHLPSRVYAICSDTNGGTVIEFMFKPKEPLVGIDDLVWIQVHAEDIENGLITVKQVLTNETLIQNADDEIVS